VNGQVRIERIGLEDHGDVAVFRVHAENRAIADPHIAAGCLGKTGNNVEQRRLAATGRPEQHEEFTAFERDVDALQRLDLSIGLADILDFERAHRVVSDGAAIAAGKS
jgi:hypothetical protein